MNTNSKTNLETALVLYLSSTINIQKIETQSKEISGLNLVVNTSMKFKKSKDYHSREHTHTHTRYICVMG